MDVHMHESTGADLGYIQGGMLGKYTYRRGDSGEIRNGSELLAFL